MNNSESMNGGGGERRPTWRQVLGVATGVHQNVGLEGGVKVVICTERGRWEVTLLVAIYIVC